MYRGRQQQFLKHSRNAVEVKRRSDAVCDGFQFGVAVVHGDAEADALEHLHVVQSVAESSYNFV